MNGNLKVDLNKRRNRKSRMSLTLLFAGTVFAILVAVLIVVGGFALVMVNADIITESGLGLVDGNTLIMMILLISVGIGAVFAFLFGRLFMKPINIVINKLNRLATGDFTARIHFDSVFSKHPTVAELTDSFNTMASELEKTEMLRSDFVNDFSHEFKTPIVSIAGFARLLKNETLDREQRREYLNIIEEESLRLSDMATNVLNLAKVENQQILSNVSAFNLSEQVRNCFLQLEDKWSGKNLDADFDFGEVQICGNEELLRQVWLNLLDNAVKFTPYGGEVRIKIEEREDSVCVSVINTGSTVAPENRERIFRKFFQEDRSHSTKGNGIGLAVVRQIVNLHGGSVWVESEQDCTTFKVLLPKTADERTGTLKNSSMSEPLAVGRTLNFQRSLKSGKVSFQFRFFCKIEGK